MRFGKKVVIAVGLADEMPASMRLVQGMDFLNHSEVHFVHLFNSINYTTLISDFPMVYPLAADRKPIEEAITALLEKTAKETLPKEFSGKVVVRCLFADSPKDGFCDYAKEIHADLIIIPTRKKRGLFESSFAQYVNKHSEANIILLK